MIEIINKIKKAIKSLENEKGPLLICALFLREEPLEKWDVVISASWLSPKEMQSYKIISSKLKEYLSDSEFLQYSRIELLNSTDPVDSYLQSLKTIDNGGYEELSRDELSDKFDFVIKKAYLLRSKKTNK